MNILITETKKMDYDLLITKLCKLTKAKGIWESTERNLRDLIKCTDEGMVYSGCCRYENLSFFQEQVACQLIEHKQIFHRNGLTKSRLSEILEGVIK
jgi:hypothetical protein